VRIQLKICKLYLNNIQHRKPVYLAPGKKLRATLFFAKKIQREFMIVFVQSGSKKPPLIKAVI